MFQPAESDDFCSVELGLQWQWQGVPSPYWYFVGPGAADEDCTNGALKLVDTQDGVVLQAVEWTERSGRRYLTKPIVSLPVRANG